LPHCQCHSERWVSVMVEHHDAEVVNETHNSRLALVRGGHEGELVYKRQGNELILVHAGVDEDLRGEGVGGLLVEAAVMWAQRDDLIIVPWCPFARRWLQKHDTIASKIQIEWSAPR
jgi:uncharacterized protein